jgi:hypothetical protein
VILRSAAAAGSAQVLGQHSQTRSGQCGSRVGRLGLTFTEVTNWMLSTWQRDVGSTEAWLQLGSQSLPARRGATCQEQELEAR